MAHEDKRNQSIRKQLVEIGAESNVHGISRIVSDRPIFLRFLWLIAFLSLATFGTFQVYTIVKLFREYPVKTAVKIGFRPLEFPAVTICNMNIIKKSQSGDFRIVTDRGIPNGTNNVDTSGSSNSATTNRAQPTTTTGNALTTNNRRNPAPTTGTPPTTTRSSNTGSTTSSYDAYAEWTSWYYNTGTTDYYGTSKGDPTRVSPNRNYVTFEAFVREFMKLERSQRTYIGHKYENMMVECQFAGMSCNSPAKQIVTSDYGNCYTLQSPRYITGTSGPRGGMTMTINLENHESFHQMSEGYGLRVVIHEVGSFPLPAQDGMTISGGYETELGIKLTQINRKGPPYSECQEPKEYFAQHFVRYSIQGCIQECWETEVLKHCECIDGYIKSEIYYFHDERNAAENTTGSQPYCSEPSIKDCYNNFRRIFLYSVSDYCKCPPPCSQSVYTTTFSGRVWPHETNLAELKNISCELYNTTGAECGLESLTGIALNSNFLKLHIYYEDLNYEEITEEPLYDINQVIADIGGSLGLCIGASLLCVFEAVEAILQLAVVLTRKMAATRRVTSKRDDGIGLDIEKEKV